MCIYIYIYMNENIRIKIHKQGGENRDEKKEKQIVERRRMDLGNVGEMMN